MCIYLVGQYELNWANIITHTAIINIYVFKKYLNMTET